MDLNEVLQRLSSSEHGLGGEDVAVRLEETGRNVLDVEEALNPLRLLVRQVHNPLIYLLAAASVLSLLVGHQVDAAVIAGVIVLNSVLGDPRCGPDGHRQGLDGAWRTRAIEADLLESSNVCGGPREMRSTEQ